MRIAKSMCLCAAVLSTAAYAEGGLRPAAFEFNATTVNGVQIPEQPDELVGPRVGVELLAGSLGGVGGGFAGLLLGASSGDLGTAGLGMLGGAALGSWLGTSLGGNALGGR